MNPKLAAFLNRLTLRQKILTAVVLSFVLWTLFNRPSPANGRYVPCGNSPQYLVDTQQGTAWEMVEGRYRRMATMP